MLKQDPKNQERRAAKLAVVEESAALAIAEICLREGRPVEYCEAFARLAFKFCLLGCKDTELAQMLSITEATLNNWKHEHPSFLESIKSGKQKSDADVVDALRKRAMGYSHPDLHIAVINGKVVKTPITKHYAPDTGAAAFWLKNRRPEHWRDRSELVSIPTDDAARLLREQMAALEQSTSVQPGANDAQPQQANGSGK